MTKAQTQPIAAKPAVTVAEPLADPSSIRGAFDAAVAQRTAANDAKLLALRAFAASPSAANAAALKAANAALVNAEDDAKTLGEVLEDVEARQVEADRLGRLAATADLRQRAASSARDLAIHGKRVEAAADVLRTEIESLRRAASAVHDDVAAAISGLSVAHDDSRDDLRALLLGRASAAGPAVSASYGGMVRGIVAATGADLSLYVEINGFARTGGSLAAALLSDAKLIASRLDVTLPALPAATKAESK